MPASAATPFVFTPLAWIIPALPLAAWVLIVLGARRSGLVSGLLTVLGVLAAFAASVLVLQEVLAGATASGAVAWLPLASALGARYVPIGFQVDPLTAVMLVVITSVSLLVQLYSLGYMTGADTRGRPVAESNGRYFATMALFTTSMLGLVLANNFVALYICWELVGLCSYLLIGHEHWRTDAAVAAKKAFLVTRLGDVGLLVGLLFLYWHTGTFEFAALADLAAAGRLAGDMLTVAILLVFLGAVGKSAQFPLHVWLPDAMEGPTPVSALIHAATMVAAGVYLMARTFPLLEHSPTALAVVATIGAFTAIFAATMGLAPMDIKRVLAFSTMSQLGYMMLAIGLGAMAAGMFHLFTHAFFKALLFLGAGSVIHAVHSNDMREMGGVGGWRPITYVTMFVAALALAGIPPLSGFWSKDEILVAAEASQPVLYGVALVTVGLTSFYMFRVIFLTFTGSYRGHAERHREPIIMPIVLLILVVPTIVSGLWGSQLVDHTFGAFLDPGHAGHPSALRMDVAAASTGLALLGLVLAFALYGGGRNAAGVPLPGVLRRLYTVLDQRYYVDHLYNWIAGGLVLGIGAVMSWFDARIVDGVVNGVGRVTVGAGAELRRVQTGELQFYAWVLLAGVVVLTILIVAPFALDGMRNVR
jgi:NADH-quinone oxidoreductase subunit L